MQVTFYKNESPKIQINKSLIQTYQKVCQAYEDFNVSSNKIILDFDEDILESNYCYNDTTKRYYYIDSVNIVDGRRMVLSCTCDVLMSFKSQIQGNGGIVSKQQNMANYYLNDSNYTIESRKQFVTKKFPNTHFSLNDGCYLIKILGG